MLKCFTLDYIRKATPNLLDCIIVFFCVLLNKNSLKYNNKTNMIPVLCSYNHKFWNTLLFLYQGIIASNFSCMKLKNCIGRYSKWTFSNDKSSVKNWKCDRIKSAKLSVASTNVRLHIRDWNASHATKLFVSHLKKYTRPTENKYSFQHVRVMVLKL